MTATSPPLRRLHVASRIGAGVLGSYAFVWASVTLGVVLGLIIFAAIYLPSAENPILQPAAIAHERAAALEKGLAFEPAKVPAKLASVDAMVSEAKRRWEARGMPGEVDRHAWQERVFWLAWLGTFAHAAWRSAPVQLGQVAPAWREQCCAVLALAVSAVLINWAATGDHLLRTLSEGYWPVAGFDLALSASAVVAAAAAIKLRGRERGAPSKRESFEPPLATRPAQAAHG